MSHPGRDPECDHCGAPYSAGLVACRYCKAAYASAAHGGGPSVTCPRCANRNRMENAQCASCHAPLARACVFCGGASRLNATACQRCGEAFAGAEDRKRARDEQQKQQQAMQLVGQGLGVVGQLAANPTVKNAMSGLFDALVDEAKKTSR